MKILEPTRRFKVLLRTAVEGHPLIGMLIAN